WLGMNWICNVERRTFSCAAVPNKKEENAVFVWMHQHPYASGAARGHAKNSCCQNFCGLSRIYPEAIVLLGQWPCIPKSARSLRCCGRGLARDCGVPFGTLLHRKAELAIAWKRAAANIGCP